MGREPRSDPYRLLDWWFSFYSCLWALVSWLCWLCSCGVLDPSGSYILSSFSLWESSELCLVFGCGPVHLLLTVVGWHVSDDEYYRFQSSGISEYRRQSFHCHYSSLIFFYYRSPCYAVSDSRSSRQRQGWVSSHDLGFKLDQSFVHYSHNFCVTFTLVQPIGRTNCRSEALSPCLSPTPGSLIIGDSPGYIPALLGVLTRVTLVGSRAFQFL